MAAFSLSAQNKSDFKEECDSLTAVLERRTSVKSSVALKSVVQNDKVLSFNFTEAIGDYPWTEADIKWFRKEIQNRLPGKYKGCVVGELKCVKTSLSRYITAPLNNDGKAVKSNYKIADNRNAVKPLVRCEDSDTYKKGLSGRHIALWQSHGRYFEQSLDRWEWQRATIFETVEDLYTQSYVVPFLVPMLENAGAVVMLPRERDYSEYESIADNNPGWNGYAGYKENGSWADAGPGFCNKNEIYYDLDNPFTMGTARKAAQKAGSKATATWTANMPERGTYAVYVSYKTIAESSDCAHYTVHHLGGETHFCVNQTMGGGMWVYLGSFELPEGQSEVVTLDAGIPKGCSSSGKYVTADAVKIGGGMGNWARNKYGQDKSTAVCSQMPRFTEAARYWLQWSGFGEEVWNQNELKHDYRDDFMCRGPWVQYLTGGSRVNPKEEGKNIPVDMSLGFHTDAGTTRDSSIIGTLAIYTLKKDNKQEYTDGSDRQAAREYTATVQSQIVDDIRATFEPEWRRRQTWDKSYSESRMPNVPAMLLELLSHQNFADMKYGLDPAFRFTVSRAIYKGMLKFLSGRYGCAYIVQPLPVNSFAATFAFDESGNFRQGTDSTYTMRLSWKDSEDSLEPTAVADRYFIYTRIADGGWDNGVRAEVRDENGFKVCEVEMPKGSICSWKVAAANDGGRSFPSQVMSAGVPQKALEAGLSKESIVMAVDNFDRVAAPTFYDSYEYAGFDNRSDGGMAYMFDASYIGDMYEWHRCEPWQDDDCPGFGASYVDYADKLVAGNTLDWSWRHGKLIFETGRAYCSASAKAFAADNAIFEGIKAIDLICGKQVTTQSGRSAYGPRHTIFFPELQDALRQYTADGGSILVSGSYIGTDSWSYVYPLKPDSEAKQKTCDFCQEVLGYKWRTNFGSHTGKVRAVGGFNFTMTLAPFQFHTSLDNKCYRVESPDGLIPANSKATTILRYCDSNVQAGVLYNADNYKCISIGFPIETIEGEETARDILGTALDKLFEK